ncbi:MAG: DUF4364 family protein [Peptoniphilaceae bacterium]
MNNTNIFELAQNKLLILYIIDKANKLFSEDELTSFMLTHDFLNYFYFKQYLNELLDSNLIEINSEDNFYITEDGKKTLDLFISRIDNEIKNKANNYLKVYKKNKIDEKSIVAKIFKDDCSRIFVNLIIKEIDYEILNLHIEAANEDYANLICEKFKNNPENLYKNIINYFTE